MLFFCCSRLQVSGLDCNVLNIYMYVLNPVLILLQSYDTSVPFRHTLKGILQSSLERKWILVEWNLITCSFLFIVPGFSLCKISPKLGCHALNIYMYILSPVLILMQNYGISKDKRRALTCVRSNCVDQRHFNLQSSQVSENPPELLFPCCLTHTATPAVPQHLNHTLLSPGHYPIHPQVFPPPAPSDIQAGSEFCFGLQKTEEKFGVLKS